MNEERKIHADQGYDRDNKYSKWRREIFPKLAKINWAYCTDIDWIEWRQGKPVAFIECRRAVGGIKTAEDAIEHVKKLNFGFQFEVLARLAKETGAKSYIVGIEDKSIDSEDYSNARFVVEEILPPDQYNEKGRINLKEIKTKQLSVMNQQQYADFIKNLKAD